MAHLPLEESVDEERDEVEEEEGLDTAAAMQEDRDPGLGSLEQVMLSLDERLFGLVDEL